MAITKSVLTEGVDGDGGASSTTASITPSANQLLLLTVCAGNVTANTVTAPSSVVGNGLTWVKVDERNDDSSSYKTNVSVWRAMGASPSAGTIVINFSGTAPNNCLWQVAQFDGVDTTGTNGSGAIAAHATAEGNATLAADVGSPAADSALFGAAVKNDTAQTPTAGTGYTQLGTYQTDGSPTILRYVELDDEAGAGHDGVVDMSWSGASKTAIVAIEIKAGVVAPPPSSDITVRSSQTAANGAAVTSLQVTKPTGVVDNDTMLAFVVIGADQTVTGVPTGWTLLDEETTGTATGDCRHYCYWKRASSEGANYTWTFSAGVDCAIVIAAYVSVNAVPIHASNHNLMVGSTTTQTGPTVTLSTPNCYLVHAFGTNAAFLGDLTFTTPPGTDPRGEADPAGATTNRAVCAVFDEPTAATGTTAARSTTINNSAKGVAYTIALAPDTGGTPPPVVIIVEPPTSTAIGEGCMLGFYETLGTSTMNTIEGLLDTKFAVVRLYHAPGDWPTVKSSTITSLTNQNRLVMVSHKPPKRGGAWIEIHRGDWDTQIDAMVTYYKSLAPKQVLVCLHHEPHDDTTDLKATPGLYGTAADFVKAYRHFMQRFRDAGADNVLLTYIAVANTWANKKASGSTVLGSGDKCYPGDDLVDVLGHDEYNSVGADHNPTPGDFSTFSGSSWHSFEDEYSDTVALAKRLNKPLIMGEIGSQHSCPLGDRGDWFRDGAYWLEHNEDARNFFKGFCYYHVDNHDSSGHWWRFVGPSTEFANDGKQGWIDGFSTNPYFKTVPIDVITENVDTSSIQVVGIQTGLKFGNPSVDMIGGHRTLFNAGGIAAPSDYDLNEEEPGLNFGTATVAMGDPPFIVAPAGIASGEAFGSPVVVKASGLGWIFTPPIRYNNPSVLPSSTGIQRALFKFYRGAPIGQNVYLLDTGVVTESPPDMNHVVKTFHGGHELTVTDTEEAILRAAGYGDYLTIILE